MSEDFSREKKKKYVEAIFGFCTSEGKLGMRLLGCIYKSWLLTNLGDIRAIKTR